MTSTPEQAPALRRVAALILGIEALALVIAAVIYAVRAIDGDAPADAALSIGALALVTGAALGFAAWSLMRGRTWPRGLGVTWQLLQISAGAVLLELSVGGGLAAIVAGVLGAVVIVADARAEPST